MTKQMARFTNAAGAKLTIFARPGKKVLNVGASLKAAKQPAQTGCRQRFALDKESDALKAFESLKNEAIRNGWTVAPTKERTTFTAIPPANLGPAPAPKKTKAA